MSANHNVYYQTRSQMLIIRTEYSKINLKSDKYFAKTNILLSAFLQSFSKLYSCLHKKKRMHAVLSTV